MADKPCHLIAGPLGVGKTTAILHYLKHKPDHERIAVLVNDFGANGLDAAILNCEVAFTPDELRITPVPGGCLCCTSAAHFEGHLKRLANDPTIDRIIIEPSGIVMLDQMRALLHGLAARMPLAPQPIAVLINAATFESYYFTHIPYFKALGDEADILIANRCDQATPKQIAAFLDWANGLEGKQVITTHFGRLPDELFITTESTPLNTSPAASARGHQKAYRSGSQEWPGDVCFDGTRLQQELQPCAEDESILRLKGTLRTEQGWQLIEIAQGEVLVRAFPEQPTNQVDWIADSTCDRDIVNTHFTPCIITA